MEVEMMFNTFTRVTDIDSLEIKLSKLVSKLISIIYFKDIEIQSNNKYHKLIKRTIIQIKMNLKNTNRNLLNSNDLCTEVIFNTKGICNGFHAKLSVK